MLKTHTQVRRPADRVKFPAMVSPLHHTARGVNRKICKKVHYGFAINAESDVAEMARSKYNAE